MVQEGDRANFTEVFLYTLPDELNELRSISTEE